MAADSLTVLNVVIHSSSIRLQWVNSHPHSNLCVRITRLPEAEQSPAPPSSVTCLDDGYRRSVMASPKGRSRECVIIITLWVQNRSWTESSVLSGANGLYLNRLLRHDCMVWSERRKQQQRTKESAQRGRIVQLYGEYVYKKADPARNVKRLRQGLRGSEPLKNLIRESVAPNLHFLICNGRRLGTLL